MRLLLSAYPGQFTPFFTPPSSGKNPLLLENSHTISHVVFETQMGLHLGNEEVTLHRSLCSNQFAHRRFDDDRNLSLERLEGHEVTLTRWRLILIHPRNGVLMSSTHNRLRRLKKLARRTKQLHKSTLHLFRFL